MSCNPAIGGVGKGHLVKEIDALGGAMARVHRRGRHPVPPAQRVEGPGGARDARAVRQARATATRCARVLEAQRRARSQAGRGRAPARRGCGGASCRRRDHASGCAFRARAVILTTGTFLRGRIHVGDAQHDGGRAGEAPSRGLSASLGALGFPLARLKTGTPCRLDGRTIDWRSLEAQPGDAPLPRFAGDGPAPPLPQLRCCITYTTDATHALIRANLQRSPLYGRALARPGIGPRYCPSIEDKVVRFADKPRHQIFLEPEGPRHARGLSQRHLDLAARRRAARAPAHDPRPRARRDDAARLRRRVRLLRSARARRRRSRPSACAGLYLRRPDQRHHRATRRRRCRGSSPAPTPRSRSSGGEPLVLAARSGLRRRARRRSDDAGHRRAVSHDDLARRASPAAARGQRRRAPDAARPPARARRRCALGAVRRAQGGARRRDASGSASTIAVADAGDERSPARARHGAACASR